MPDASSASFICFANACSLSVSFGFILKDFESTILASQNCTDVMIWSFSYETSLWVIGYIAIYEFSFAVPTIPSILT